MGPGLVVCTSWGWPPLWSRQGWPWGGWQRRGGAGVYSLPVIAWPGGVSRVPTYTCPGWHAGLTCQVHRVGETLFGQKCLRAWGYYCAWIQGPEALSALGDLVLNTGDPGRGPLSRRSSNDRPAERLADHPVRAPPIRSRTKCMRAMLLSLIYYRGAHLPCHDVL